MPGNRRAGAESVRLQTVFRHHRDEPDAGRPGGAGDMIMDLDQHTNYMVMNANMCMQTTTPQAQQNPFSQARNATVERTAAGTDTVDGHPCKVENVTVTPQNGEPHKMKVWEAQDLKGFPIKIETESARGPMTIEYKDISFSEPDRKSTR